MAVKQSWRCPALVAAAALAMCNQAAQAQTTSDQWTFGVSAEATYDWQRDKLAMPVLATVSKLFMSDKQPVSFTIGGKHNALTPENGPKGFGASASIVFLFPT